MLVAVIENNTAVITAARFAHGGFYTAKGNFVPRENLRGTSHVIALNSCFPLWRLALLRLCRMVSRALFSIDLLSMSVFISRSIGTNFLRILLTPFLRDLFQTLFVGRVVFAIICRSLRFILFIPVALKLVRVRFLISAHIRSFGFAPFVFSREVFHGG